MVCHVKHREYILYSLSHALQEIVVLNPIVDNRPQLVPNTVSLSAFRFFTRSDFVHSFVLSLCSMLAQVARLMLFLLALDFCLSLVFDSLCSGPY